MRAPAAADPRDHDVTRLSEERLDLVSRCHLVTLPGLASSAAAPRPQGAM